MNSTATLYRIDPTLRASPRFFHGIEQAVLERAWTKADAFVTSLPRLRMVDAELVSRKRLAKIADHLRAWPAAQRPYELGMGRVGTLGPDHPCLLLRAPTTAGLLADALSRREAVVWAPPGGWEDLVLLRGGKIIAWSSTHNRWSIFRSSDAGVDRGFAPGFSVELEVTFVPLTVPPTP